MKPSFTGVANFLAPVLLIGVSIVLVIRSTGFVEADEISHFLKARYAWENWREILDIWGRPLCTGLFALPAPWGLPVARLFAVGLTALVMMGTIQLGRALVVRRPESIFTRYLPAWLSLLLYAQPLFLMNSFGVLSEMLLALCWVWAAVACAERRLVLAAFFIGLGGLARPEGWLALAGWPVMLWALQQHFRPWPSPRRTVVLSLLVAGMPVLLWYLVGWWAFHSPAWFIANWPWPVKSVYSQTPWQFAAAVLWAMGCWMIIPVGIGIGQVLRNNSAKPIRALLILVPVFGLVGLHGMLSGFGLFGSMSLARYLVPAAPFLAILTVIGLDALPCYRLLPRRLLPLLVCGLALGPLLLYWQLGKLPVPKSTYCKRIDQAVNRLATAGPYLHHTPVDRNPGHLIAANPYVAYRLGTSLNTAGRERLRHPSDIGAAPAGTVLIQDAGVWDHDGYPSGDRLRAWGYEEIAEWAPNINSIPQTSVRPWLDPDDARVTVWIKTQMTPPGQAPL